MTSIPDHVAEAVLELKRRNEHITNTYIPGDDPMWDQKRFLSSEARYRLLFGGNQSGKSHTAAYEITCWLRGSHPYREVPAPPNKVWSISAEYTTLEEGVYRHLKDMIPDWEIEKYGPLIPQQNLSSYIMLKNGSVVNFKSAQGKSRGKFQAAAIDLISLDEEVDGDIWTELQARTLATGGNFIISATLVESYEWIVQLEEMADKGHKDYTLVRLNTKHNPYLHQETVAHLDEAWSSEEKEVRFEGKSRRSRGLIYNTWEPNAHVVKKFSPPLEWPRWCAIDPGIRTFAVLWIAVDPNNHAYAYRELYLHNIPLWEVAETIRAAEGWKLDRHLSYKYDHYVWEETPQSEHMVDRLIDDKISSRLITGDEGVLDQLHNKYGILCTPADKSVRAGIEDVRHWLEPLDDKKPGFMVMDHLENFLNERKKYRIRTTKAKKDSNEPVDDPLKKDDHLMDCWRYLARLKPKFSDRRITTPFTDEYTPEMGALLEGRHIPNRHKRQPELIHEFLGSEW